MIIEHQSGGAIGSDITWQMIGRKILKYPIKLISTHYYMGRKTPYGNCEISHADYEEGATAVRRANGTLKRKPSGHMDLLSRNWIPVREADGVFAITNIEKNGVSGGTAWGVQMAMDNGIPAYIFDQQTGHWKEYVDDYWKWSICECPILTKKFAGIGTRFLKPNGLAAIEQIYTKSYEYWMAEIDYNERNGDNGVSGFDDPNTPQDI